MAGYPEAELELADAKYASMTPAEVVAEMEKKQFDGPVSLSEALVAAPSLLLQLAGVPESVVSAVSDWAVGIDSVAVPRNENDAVKALGKNRTSRSQQLGFRDGWWLEARVYQVRDRMAGLTTAQELSRASLKREITALGVDTWKAGVVAEVSDSSAHEAILQRIYAGDDPLTDTFWDNAKTVDETKSATRSR